MLLLQGHAAMSGPSVLGLFYMNVGFMCTYLMYCCDEYNDAGQQGWQPVCHVLR